MSGYRLCAATFLIVALGACTPREPVASSEPVAMPSVSNVPPQRSYLDPGPAPGRGGPNYIRDNLSNGPRQTDSFGNDLLTRAP